MSPFISGGCRLPAPPLDEDLLEEARAVRQREVMMKRAIRDVIINLTVGWILFSVAYSNRDSRSYLMHKEIYDSFIEPKSNLTTKLPKFTTVKNK